MFFNFLSFFYRVIVSARQESLFTDRFNCSFHFIRFYHQNDSKRRSQSRENRRELVANYGNFYFA